MASKREITEARLREALQRLLDGCPVRTKPTGKLTLNKVNNEAGLGNSYIHKFPDVVEYANPIINTYNKAKRKLIEDGLPTSTMVLSEVEKLRIDKKREERLKEQYRQGRDDARKAKTELEALNNTLMFRVYELQEELRHYKVKLLPTKSENM